jgi:hypothetical protein
VLPQGARSYSQEEILAGYDFTTYAGFLWCSSQVPQGRGLDYAGEPHLNTIACAAPALLHIFFCPTDPF